jgi:uncharacterized protein YndB with AHSA1/START domain
VNPITLTLSVARPREEVFAYLSDIANHPQFSDHYLTEWRLTRLNSVGLGAGARFRIEAPFMRYAWADITFVEVQAPYRIVGEGFGGKNNRVKLRAEWQLLQGPGQTTRLSFTVETEPASLSDRFAQSLGRRRWARRKGAKALARLRTILEENRQAGQRATVGGMS